MAVNLSPQLEALVRSKLASGPYTSVGKAVREVLRPMDEQVRPRLLRVRASESLANRSGERGATAMSGSPTLAVGSRPEAVRRCSRIDARQSTAFPSI